MSFSIQTNVNSLIAQENLRVNSDFQSRTIQRLTSGYRINSSGDDAAGLAIANLYRSDTSELTQGVRNANDGISALQIVDGGLNNISKILDRLKTLATQSASDTFKGDRNTLDTEYQALLTEIDRQATNVGMTAGGKYNVDISVYIGGGSSQASASISVDLSGSVNRVDSNNLGVGGSSILGASTGLTSNTQVISDSVTFLKSSAVTTPVETFTFTSYEGSAATSFNVVLTGGSNGLSATEALASLNSQLDTHGIRAIVDSNHKLAFASSRAFTVRDDTNAGISGMNATSLATNATVGINSAMYSMGSSTVGFTAMGASAQATVKFVNANGTVTVTLNGANANTTTAAVDTLNSKLAAYGIYAVKDSSAGQTGITLQSKLDFAVTGLGFCSFANGTTPASTVGAAFGVSFGQMAQCAVTDPTDASTDSTSSAKLAITAIGSAVTNLGAVQGKIGTAQNKMQYAINLAQSQISGFAAAESRIRDTDVAAEAANLTKAQVLQQASMAAMAQANSAPQAVLSLLRG